MSKSLSVLPHGRGWAVSLERLPVAAGLGGGSADAGALFRLVRDAHGLPDDWQARAARLGAGVPACVDSVACVGRGTGTELSRVDNDLAGTPVLLVNPEFPWRRGRCSAPWDGQDRGAMPEGAARGPSRWPGATILSARHRPVPGNRRCRFPRWARQRPCWRACPARARRALRSTKVCRRAMRRRIGSGGIIANGG